MKRDEDFDLLLTVIYSSWKVHKRYDFPVTSKVILDKCSEKLFYAGLMLFERWREITSRREVRST